MNWMTQALSAALRTVLLLQQPALQTRAVSLQPGTCLASPRFQRLNDAPGQDRIERVGVFANFGAFGHLANVYFDNLERISS